MKSTMPFRFVATLVVLFLAGCALTPKHADGPAFSSISTPAGKAVIYFYRPERFAMSATTNFMSIPLKANNCYAMVNGGYFAYVTDPGKITIGSVSLGAARNFSLNVKAGDVKYVDVSLESKFSGPAPTFNEVAKAEALPIIKGLNLISACD